MLLCLLDTIAILVWCDYGTFYLIVVYLQLVFYLSCSGMWRDTYWTFWVDRGWWQKQLWHHPATNYRLLVDYTNTWPWQEANTIPSWKLWSQLQQWTPLKGSYYHSKCIHNAVKLIIFWVSKLLGEFITSGSLDYRIPPFSIILPLAIE